MIETALVILIVVAIWAIVTQLAPVSNPVKTVIHVVFTVIVLLLLLRGLGLVDGRLFC